MYNGIPVRKSPFDKVLFGDKSELAFFGALTSVGAPFFCKKFFLQFKIWCAIILDAK